MSRELASKSGEYLGEWDEKNHEAAYNNSIH